MWYFIAKWRIYNEIATAQFMSLNDIIKWWETEFNNDAWGLEVYDRNGYRIFINIVKPYPGQIEYYNKIGLKYIDLTNS